MLLPIQTKLLPTLPCDHNSKMSDDVDFVCVTVELYMLNEALRRNEMHCLDDDKTIEEASQHVDMMIQQFFSSFVSSRAVFNPEYFPPTLPFMKEPMYKSNVERLSKHPEISVDWTPERIRRVMNHIVNVFLQFHHAGLIVGFKEESLFYWIKVRKCVSTPEAKREDVASVIHELVGYNGTNNDDRNISIACTHLLLRLLIIFDTFNL